MPTPAQHLLDPGKLPSLGATLDEAELAEADLAFGVELPLLAIATAVFPVGARTEL